jgi:hypothetical protein
MAVGDVAAVRRDLTRGLKDDTGLATVVSCQGKVAEKSTIARQSLSPPQHQGMSHVLDFKSHPTVGIT